MKPNSRSDILKINKLISLMVLVFILLISSSYSFASSTVKFCSEADCTAITVTFGGQTHSSTLNCDNILGFTNVLAGTYAYTAVGCGVRWSGSVTVNGTSTYWMSLCPNGLLPTCNFGCDSSGSGSFVCQPTAPPVISVSPPSRDVAKDAGTTTFSVSNTGTGTMPWTAAVTPTSSWLTITSGTSGTDSGTINCSFPANTSTSTRTATIRVTATGATGSPVDVTVTQAPTPVPTPTPTPAPTPTPTPTPGDDGDTCATATPITLSGGAGSRSGSLTAGDYDYFRVDVTSPGTLTVYTTGSTDTYGYLKNSDCTDLAYNDDSGGINFSISQSVTEGTYYVAVRHYSSSGIGAYTLNVQFVGGTPTPSPTPTPVSVLSVTPSSQAVAKNAGMTTFNVSNTGNGTMTWGALVTSGSWLTITSGSSGTDAGTISCSFTANTGTAARTATIQITATGATGSPKDVTVTQSPTSTTTRYDFNSDGKPDILWRNTSTGENFVWYMNGAAFSEEVSLQAVHDTNWTIVGAADFNSDGKSDILWRNTSTGENYIWYMDGSIRAGGDYLRSITDLNWTIVGTGDFNGDGKTDILWRNTSTGEHSIWYMNGATLVGGGYLYPTVADLNWTIVGTGDFDSDGKTDILWRNTSTGENSLWYMDGATIVGEGYLYPTVADLNLTIVGTGDFNSDGKTDILWRNTSTGENSLWYMDGATIVGGGYLYPTVADLNWMIVGTGDFNSDSKTDILWRNTSTGENSLWYMDGATIFGGGYLYPTVADLNWKIVNH